MAETIVCRLCLNFITSDESQPLDTVSRTILIDIVPKVDLDISLDPKVCQTCYKAMLKCYKFKSNCRKVDSAIEMKKDSSAMEVDIDDPQVQGSEKKCDFCSKILDEESLSDFNSHKVYFREVIQQCLRDLVFSHSSDTVPCKLCLETLTAYYTFVGNCMDTEDKLCNYRSTLTTKDQAKIDLYKAAHYISGNDTSTSDDPSFKEIDEGSFSTVYIKTESIEVETHDVKTEMLDEEMTSTFESTELEYEGRASRSSKVQKISEGSETKPDFGSPSKSTLTTDTNLAEDDLYYGHKVRRPKNFCLFCNTLVQSFARHLTRNHTQEPEVKELMSYPTSHSKRKELLTALRKKSNFVNSYGVQKAVKRSNLSTGVLPCSNCLGFFSKKQLRRHMKTCDENLPTQKAQVHAQNFMVRHVEVDDDLKNKVFPKMRPDKISLAAKKDKLICAFGTQYIQTNTGAFVVNVISRKMRELAKIVMEIQKTNPEITSLFDIFRPKYFPLMIDTTKKVIGYENDTNYRSSLARSIRASLRQCCEIAITYASNQQRTFTDVSNPETESELKTGMRLLLEDWPIDVFSNIIKKQIPILSIVRDVKLFKSYLDVEGDKASNLLQSDCNEKNYSTLTEIVFCKIVLLNRATPKDLQTLLYKGNISEEILVNDLITLTEKILLQRFKLTSIPRRKSSDLPILLSTDIQKQLNVLLKYKNRFLKEETPYLFRNLKSDVLQNHALLSGLKHPKIMLRRELQAPITLSCQIFNMVEAEMEQLGRCLCIEQQPSKRLDDIYQTSTFVKALLRIDKRPVRKLKETIEGGTEGSSTLELNVRTRKNESLCLKKKRKLVKWMDDQKEVVTLFFADHIKNKKPPKQKECEELKSAHRELLYNKDWLKIKAFVQSKYR